MPTSVAAALARWATAGSVVHLVVCTDGGKGTRDPGVVPAQLAAERAAELEASSALIGLSTVDNLGFPDGELADSEGVPVHPGGAGAGATARRGLRARPHGGVLRAGLLQPSGPPHCRRRADSAVAPASALPHHFPDAGPAHQVSTVLLSGTLEPDEWVDVTDTIEAKAAAVECHRTQFAGQGGWAGEAVRRRAAEEGRRAGVGYAEGFRRLTLGA